MSRAQHLFIWYTRNCTFTVFIYFYMYKKSRLLKNIRDGVWFSEFRGLAGPCCVYEVSGRGGFFYLQCSSWANWGEDCGSARDLTPSDWSTASLSTSREPKQRSLSQTVGWNPNIDSVLWSCIPWTNKHGSARNPYLFLKLKTISTRPCPSCFRPQHSLGLKILSMVSQQCLLLKFCILSDTLKVVLSLSDWIAQLCTFQWAERTKCFAYVLCLFCSVKSINTEVGL